MLSDLRNYELINLLLFENMPPEAQKHLLEQFFAALAMYLAQELSQHFRDEPNAEFDALMKNPDISEKEIEEYYKRHLPNMQQEVDTKILEFKKTCLLKIYEHKLQSLKDLITKKQVSLSENQTVIPIWEEIVKYTRENNWERVSGLLKTINH